MLLFIAIIFDAQLNSGLKLLKNCIVTPAGAESPDMPAREDQIVEIQCNMDGDFDLCVFGHYKPFEFGTGQDFRCTITPDMPYGVCPGDRRISTISSYNMCGIRISNPEPDDIGKWTVDAGELINGQFQTDQIDLTLYTFNQTTSRLVNEWTDQDIGARVTVSMNERLDIKCLSQYGSPAPRLIWRINGQKVLDGNIFHDTGVMKGRCYDYDQYVCDYDSIITFDVNSELLDYLDINQESEDINFDLECLVKQGEDDNDLYYEEIKFTRIEVIKETMDI